MARQWDLGNRKRGEIVEVTLQGRGANVLLLDSANLSNYKARRRTRYRGGLGTRSPYRATIPSGGHWYVVVSMDGLRGSRHGSAASLEGSLPEQAGSMGGS